jgi:hypothetical protein
MSNKNIITSYFKTDQVEQDYLSPVLTLNGQIVSTMYAFLSKVDPWPDDNSPPAPTQDTKNVKKVFKNMFVAKKIETNQISPVIQRFDWTDGTVYDYYKDDVDMFETDQNGFLVLKFYIKNRYDQVFKCLWNNLGQPSTDEPFFQPGSYGTNNVFLGGDGYKWKYMYTIDIGRKRLFMDENWMPVPAGANTPTPYLTSAGYGNIDVINVINGGAGYDTLNSYITVVITGDGTGATADAIVDYGMHNDGGIITDIYLNTPGQNYTYANVSVVAYTSSNLAQLSDLGYGAYAIAPVSPVGGHAYDPISELGCHNVMYTAEFNGSEGDMIPTDIDYRQVGLIANPLSVKNVDAKISPPLADEAIYWTFTKFSVASGFGAYQQDETIIQRSSNGEIYFTGTVVNFDTSTNIINVINIVGTPTINGSVFGNTSGTARTLIGVVPPDFIVMSGYLAYIENRSSVERSYDGIEQLRFVLEY